jgi:hypothetical protein
VWQEVFYGLMARAKHQDLPFHEVLHALHDATGRHEASFASKLVATFDPSKPVIDAVVLKNVGLRLPPYAAAQIGRYGFATFTANSACSSLVF